MSPLCDSVRACVHALTCLYTGYSDDEGRAIMWLGGRVANIHSFNTRGDGFVPLLRRDFWDSFLESVQSSAQRDLKWSVSHCRDLLWSLMLAVMIMGKTFLVTKMDRYTKYQTKRLHTHTYTTLAHTIVGGYYLAVWPRKKAIRDCKQPNALSYIRRGIMLQLQYTSRIVPLSEEFAETRGTIVYQMQSVLFQKSPSSISFLDRNYCLLDVWLISLNPGVV